mmetsp:Transcript_17374/g.48992  ORF Transcript_17374/g.48992 Transcript_17374/m.48992 type:complete len:239 (+) Transcript_17374:1169-1885(+)
MPNMPSTRKVAKPPPLVLTPRTTGLPVFCAHCGSSKTLCMKVRQAEHSPFLMRLRWWSHFQCNSFSQTSRDVYMECAISRSCGRSSNTPCLMAPGSTCQSRCSTPTMMHTTRTSARLHLPSVPSTPSRRLRPFPPRPKRKVKLSSTSFMCGHTPENMTSNPAATRGSVLDGIFLASHSSWMANQYVNVLTSLSSWYTKCWSFSMPNPSNVVLAIVDEALAQTSISANMRSFHMAAVCP